MDDIQYCITIAVIGIAGWVVIELLLLPAIAYCATSIFSL